MPSAKLRLTVPEEIWLGELTRSHPETQIRVLAAIPDGLSGVGLIEIAGQTTDSVVAAMRAEDDVTEIEVLQRGDGEALVQFETSNPLLLLPARGSSVPLEMPFDIRDGEVTWEVTAPTEQLSELGTQLDEFGIPFSVEYIRQETARERLLTDRQREVVEAAVAAGYYDTPRQCSLTELADRIGVAKSTCSNTLHRAEEAIVKEHVRREVVSDLSTA
ncbi:helix-turn-helix domain-containing protein [Haloarcula sp. S1CR25-12]|uniref:Helix-turn-helix domain-containing protein n=1 Tax=Haloarcula saliterrae TaxID=2950534 RepID=A0ABU2FHE4_9EURY|nr:helix-turn-helix domain-containing protein [Haloarcula sp. S1CR25-12]MDS0261196.1 helix-turn-helix domain-containing protein [Haloarcula sp. S1CR25-12]